MSWPKIVVMCTIYAYTANAGAIDSALSSEDHVTEPISTNDTCDTWECLMPGGPSSEDSVVKQISTDDVCNSWECLIAAYWIEGNINSSVDPCDDFYEFTCGRFGTRPTSPGTHPKNIFDRASNILDLRLKYIIEDIDKKTSAKPYKLVRILYDNCLNNRKYIFTIAELQMFLNRMRDIYGWPVIVGNLWRTLYMSNADLLSNLFELSFKPDIEKNEQLVPWITPTIRVLDPEILRMGFTNEIVQAYYTYMVDIAVIFGAERGVAENELRDVVLVEIMLANDSLSEPDRWTHHLAHTRITVREFANKYPTLRIRDFIYSSTPQAYKLTDNNIIIVPKDFDNVNKVLSQTPKRVMGNLVWWLRVELSLELVAGEVRDRMRKFDSLIGKRAQPVEPWRKCIRVVQDNLGLSLSALYQRKHIEQQVRSDMDEMATFVRQKIYEIVQEAEWLDFETKKEVLQKVAKLTGHVSFRNEYINDKKLEEFYENLELSEGDVEQSIANISYFWSNYTDSLLRHPLEKDNWIIDGNLVTMVATYNPNVNTYAVPAGLVCSDYYEFDRPKFLNYALLGSVIAHEMSHSLDCNGVFIDQNGHFREWWPSETKQKFDERVEAMIGYYGNLTVDEVGLKLHAYHNRDENIADNLGVQAAYRAYLKWIRNNKEEKLLPGLVYTPQQMFWIGVGNLWCTNHTNLELMNVVLTDPHSPAKFRVNGALANLPEFSNDFGCKLGSNMNPVKKSPVW